MKLTIANTGIHQDDEGRFSLNDLHKAAGGIAAQQPSNFLRNDQAQALIVEINQSSDLRSDKAGIPALVSRHGGRSPGTFACKELVYAYAMWISPSFHLQVIRAYDALATGDAEEAQRIAKVGAGSTALDKLRTANALKLAEETAAKLCARFSRLGESAQQVIYAKIINPIVGDEVLMLPTATEKLLLAGEVGDLLGVSAQRIGRISNKYGMKTAEYGEFRLDKSRHSVKQVEVFCYNSKAVDMFRLILDEEGAGKVVSITGDLLKV